MVFQTSLAARADLKGRILETNDPHERVVTETIPLEKGGNVATVTVSIAETVVTAGTVLIAEKGRTDSVTDLVKEPTDRKTNSGELFCGNLRQLRISQNLAIGLFYLF